MKLISSLVPVLSVTFVVLLSACEKKAEVTPAPQAATSTFETARLSSAIDAYAAKSDDASAANVDKAFAELDGEITEFSKRVASASGAEQTEEQIKLTTLKEFRNKEMMRYTEAQAKATTGALKDGAEDVGDTLKEAGQDAGEGIKEAAEAVKDGVENAVDAVKEKMP